MDHKRIRERFRLIDKFAPKIYVSGAQEDIERLISRLYKNWEISSWCFTEKYVKATDQACWMFLQTKVYLFDQPIFRVPAL